MKALDLFAGTGWGVACKWLGIKEYGVEIMPEAVATRAANGMETIYSDVWDGLERPEIVPAHDLLIASPPCQTFSLAGKGSGRKALDEVLEAIHLHAYKDFELLREFGEKHDPRTALVLAPLAYIHDHRPRLVALEQVPSVLPVWDAYAEVLRGMGYSVETAVLNAEQYGVPQTRRRAILVANRDGGVELPSPTHSRYYSRTPEKLDIGVLPWISMAEALGWGATDQPSHTVTAGVHGPTDRWASGGNSVRKALDAKIGGPIWVAKPDRGGVDSRTTYAERFDVEDVAAIQSHPTFLRSNYGTGGDPAARGERGAGSPAPTLTSKADRNKWDGERNLSVAEAAALQSYPTVFRNGNQAHAAKRPLNAPAPTIMFGARSNKVEWMDASIAHDPAASGIRVTVEEAGVLQTYERPFIWCGTKTKKFLQIGNAVPPVLAHAILSALTNEVS